MTFQCDFSWQVQYLVMLQCHFSCQVQQLVMLQRHFFVAGAILLIFGDVGVSLLVAGAAFGEIWIDSRSEKGCNFQYKMRF